MAVPKRSQQYDQIAILVTEKGMVPPAPDHHAWGSHSLNESKAFGNSPTAPWCDLYHVQRVACSQVDPLGYKHWAETQKGLVAYSLQNQAIYATPKKLAVFDMDSTLIQIEVIDELARSAGVLPEVAAITERAMQGELDFAQSLHARLSLLRGVPEQVLYDLAAHLPVTPGAAELVKKLKVSGCRTVLVSGGFDIFAQQLQKLIGLDEVIANRLEILGGALTGKILGPIIDAKVKKETLLSQASKLGINHEAVIAVGDGANDIPMLQSAGLGVAFDAKLKVRRAVSSVINKKDLILVSAFH